MVKMIKPNKPGYILVLTLIIMALATAIVTRLFYQGSAYLPLTNLAIDRKKAKNLALGGVQLALSKLNSLPAPNKSPDQNGESQKTKSKPKEQQFLDQILPIINQWDTVNFKQEIDGIDGKVQFCLTCENGKINLNQLYDFTKHEFKDFEFIQRIANKANERKQNYGLPEELLEKAVSEYEQALGLLLTQIGKITAQEQEFEQALGSLISFLASRKYQLLDVTELLEISEFSYFKTHVFREPINLQDQDQSHHTRNIYLTDIFTVSTASPKLEPWLFSDSNLTILGFPTTAANDIMKRTAAVTGWTANFKISSQWQADWDKTVGLMYEVQFKDVNKSAISLLEPQFKPQVFSVLSYGTVGNITQKVCAIIKSQTQGKAAQFVVEKLYSI